MPRFVGLPGTLLIENSTRATTLPGILFRETLNKNVKKPTLFWTVFQDGVTRPTPQQVLAGNEWVQSLYSGSTIAPTENMLQVFPEVTGINSGTYRAAFVWFDGSRFSSVATSPPVTIIATATGLYLVVWHNSSWAPVTIKVWNGTIWASGILKRWNGTSWDVAQ